MDSGSLPAPGAKAAVTAIQQSEVAIALPAALRSGLTIDNETLFFLIPEPYSLLFNASGSWGSSETQIVGYVRRPEDEPFDFAIVLSVPHLSHSDLFIDDNVAKEANSQLPNPSATLCIFLKWPGISKEKADAIVHLHPDAASLLDILQRSDPSHVAPFRTTNTGISVNVRVAFADWASSKSVLKRLSDIEHAGGSSSVHELLLSCAILKADGDSEQFVDSVTFSASLDALPILDSVALKNVDLSLLISRPGSNEPFNTKMKLTSRIILGIFNADDPWISAATLTVDKASHRASLIVASPNSQEQSMVQLGGVRLSNINFQVDYSFGKQTTLEAFLSVDVHIGTRKSRGVVVFDGIRASVLFFVMDGTLTIEELLDSILGISLSFDSEISFSDMRFYYSWNNSTIVLPETPDKLQDEDQRTFEPGFNAQVRITFLGHSINAVVRIVPTGPDKGLFISTKLLDPLDLVILSLWDTKDPKSGPYFEYAVNDSKDHGVTIACGLTIIGLTFENVEIHSGNAVKGGDPCLSVKLDFISPWIAGGKAPVTLEFVAVNKKTHIRFNGVPLSDIIDAFSGKQLMDKIKELTKKDPCGEIDLQDLVENKWAMNVEWSEDQPPEEERKTPRCSFDIYGSWKIIFKPTKEVITEVDMKPFKVTINVPKSWEDIWQEVFNTIANAITEIVQRLIDNVDQFSKILAFFAAKYAIEKWLNEALKNWLCRHPDAPVPPPHKDPDPPKPPPEPQPTPTPTPIIPVLVPWRDPTRDFRKIVELTWDILKRPLGKVRWRVRRD